MKHLIAIIIFAFLFLSTFAQKDRENLLQYFDKVDIYPKTKILRTAYKVKDGKFEGYAVDFNEKGEPILIGQYKAGIRTGEWLMPNGHTLLYDKPKPGIGVPAEGRDYTYGEKQFKSLYAMFTSTPHAKQ
jgi:hypothetical protein